jgi:hypothetical protein
MNYDAFIQFLQAYGWRYFGGFLNELFRTELFMSGN